MLSMMKNLLRRAREYWSRFLLSTRAVSDVNAASSSDAEGSISSYPQTTLSYSTSSSIFSQMGQTPSVTEPTRALRHFTDRASLIREFLHRVYTDASPGKVLYLYADGGVGKSLLLKLLHRYCCHRLSEQEMREVVALGDDELITYLQTTSARDTIPNGYLNFDTANQGLDQPRDVFSALLSLRRQLLPSGMRFPLFDLAVAWYLAQTGRLNQVHLEAVIPPEVTSLGAVIVDGLTSSTWGSVVAGIIENIAQRTHADESLRLRWMQRNLGEEDVQEIRALSADSELFDKLPEYFAQDLNLSLSGQRTPMHAVLFFDTHEAFWGNERDLSRDLFFKRDEWLRRLIGNLSPPLGIDVVIAGRDPIQWPSAPLYPIGEEHIERYNLEYFNRDDAGRYLLKVGIPQAAQSVLTEQATVDADRILPFYLGLLADTALSLRQKGMEITDEALALDPSVEQRGRVLVANLLRYVDKDVEIAIRALAAALSFDEGIFNELANRIRFNSTRAAFETITDFSFVTAEDADGQAQFRIQPLLRRILHELDDGTTREAHTILQEYYDARAQTDPAVLAKAIYHNNQLDWGAGVIRWLGRFRDAVQQADYATCSPLLSIRPQLTVKTDLRNAQILAVEGEYYARMARYEDALAAYSGALAKCETAEVKIPADNSALNLQLASCRGDAHVGAGQVQVQLSRHEEALRNLEAAVEHFQRAHGSVRGDVNAINGIGRAKSEIAELNHVLTEYLAAHQNFEEALEYYNQALETQPGNKGVQNNKGNAFLGRGKLQHELGQYEDAVSSLQSALGEFYASAQPPNENPLALNNAGIALIELADLQLELGEYKEAHRHYLEALRALDKQLDKTPELAQALTNKSLAYIGLAHLHHSLGEYNRARVRYRSAIRLNLQALDAAPLFTYAHSNLALAYAGSADVLRDMGRYDEARQSYEISITRYATTTEISPKFVNALVNRGNAQAGLGYLNATLGNFPEADQCFTAAAESYALSLESAANSVGALSNQAALYIRMARIKLAAARYKTAPEVQNERGQLLADADHHIAEALGLCSVCTDRAPEYAEVYNHKGAALSTRGDIRALQGDVRESERRYFDALSAFARARERFQRPILVFNNIGNTLTDLGQLKMLQHDFGGAREYLERAIQAYRNALNLAPGYLDALNNLAGAFVHSGDLEATVQRESEAIRQYRLADEVIVRAQGTAPNFISFHVHRAAVLQSLAQVKRATGNTGDACSDLSKAKAELDLIIASARESANVHQLADEIQTALQEWCTE